MADRIGQQLGNYRLVRLLGKGGFAEVYLGEHEQDRTLAAVKVLYTRLSSPEDLKAFIKEARSFRLTHPHIVRLLDFDIGADESPFLVMEYAPNGTLRQRYPRGSRLPLGVVVTYVTQVATALQYAHDKGLIHRDVKPENMLLGQHDEVLLSDFGIATIAHSTSSMSVQVATGTVPYMAPEQIQGKPRPASDQYSLGIVVYEWLSGDRPFSGSYAEIAIQQSVMPPPSLCEQVPELSPMVEQVVLTSLAKDPKQRFGSVQAFAKALEQASQVETPQTVQASWPPQPPDTVPMVSESQRPTEPVSPLDQVAVSTDAVSEAAPTEAARDHQVDREEVNGFPKSLAEERSPEAERLREAEESQARKVEEERIRQVAEEKARKAEEERLRKAREERARKAEEERLRKAREERARKAEEERLRKAREEQARAQQEGAALHPPAGSPSTEALVSSALSDADRIRQSKWFRSASDRYWGIFIIVVLVAGGVEVGWVFSPLYPLKNDQNAVSYGLLFVAPFVFGLLGAASAIAQAQDSYNFKRKGVTAEGSIIKHRTDGSSYYVTYSYSSAGKTYSHESEVSKQQFEVLGPGAKVRVTYLPEDPTTSRLIGEKSYITLMFGCAIICLIICLLFILAFFSALTHPYGY